MLRCCTEKSAPAMAEGYQESTKHVTNIFVLIIAIIIS